MATHHTLTKCQEKGQKPTKDILQKGLDGNLCRCTGYRPILDACKVSKLSSCFKSLFILFWKVPSRRVRSVQSLSRSLYKLLCWQSAYQQEWLPTTLFAFHCSAEPTSMHVAHNGHAACMQSHQAVILHACSQSSVGNAVSADVSQHIQLPDAETHMKQLLVKPN